MVPCNRRVRYQINHYGITVPTKQYDITIRQIFTIYYNAVASGGLKEPCIRWGSRLAHAKEQFLAERMSPGMREDTYAVTRSAKMAEQIKMLFGFWTWVGRMKRRQCRLMSNYFDHLFRLLKTPF